MANEIIEKYESLDLQAIVNAEAVSGPLVLNETTTSITVDAADIEMLSLPTFADGETRQFKHLKAVKVQIGGNECYLYDGIGNHLNWNA